LWMLLLLLLSWLSRWLCACCGFVIGVVSGWLIFKSSSCVTWLSAVASSRLGGAAVGDKDRGRERSAGGGIGSGGGETEHGRLDKGGASS
jgi:hypothetical protein